MTKNIKFSFINYKQINLDEIKRRNQLRLCMMVNDDSFFICQNEVKPFLFFLIPMNKPESIWLDQSMLCDRCLNGLSKNTILTSNIK